MSKRIWVCDSFLKQLLFIRLPFHVLNIFYFDLQSLNLIFYSLEAGLYVGF